MDPQKSEKGCSPHELYQGLKKLFDECSNRHDPRNDIPLFDELYIKKQSCIERK